MKKIYTNLIFLIFYLSLSGISIYQIQYTENQADGTYPSLFEGQIVTTGGIVSATNYHNGRFFISSSQGGAWNGLFVYSNDYNVNIGDSLLITATVYEYNGFTELSNIQSLIIISHNNPIPPPTIVTTSQVATNEAYESVLVEIDSPNVISGYDQYNNWIASNSNIPCNVDDEFFTNSNIQNLVPILENYQFEKIVGIVNYSYSEYRLNPRNLSDFYSNNNADIISIDAATYSQGEYFNIPIKISYWGNNQNISSYSFRINFDATILEFMNYTVEGTLSENGTISQVQNNPDNVSINFTGNFSFIGTQPLIILQFNSIGSGVVTPSFDSFSINEIQQDWFYINPINILPSNTSIGDTISVILKPLQNIPIIIEPDNDFTIQCKAPLQTSNWQAELEFKDTTIPLSLTDIEYNTNLERWFLTAHVPMVDLYELYNLKVTAGNNIEDTTTHSVYVIDHFKSDYTFVHITDTHLPTHIFSNDEESLTDSTSMTDLREVIKDINIIHPEFVLLTGDLVNEGELEDFENRRYFTKAQRILTELEVPFYLVSGNHDLGGWNDTPPPPGTSRKNWWRFFGWNYLQNPPETEPYYTQNYSFDYGETHYIGMEAYINYDGYMQQTYGNQSFTNRQIEWLNNDIQQAPNSSSKVLFYHYDFSNQIDLAAFGVDLALWGHIHEDSGNINQYPYNLATASVCDGKRAYRLVKVESGEIFPQNSLRAGANGENLSVTFYPSNYGVADSVNANVINNQNINFEDAMIKFIMPDVFEEFLIENGTLLQIDENNDTKVCYVSFSIPANDDMHITCKGYTSSVPNNEIEEIFEAYNYPNPMKNNTIISFKTKTKISKKITIDIYNLRGEKVKRLFPKISGETYYTSWDGKDIRNKKVSSGLYFYRIKEGDKTLFSKKILLIK